MLYSHGCHQQKKRKMSRQGDAIWVTVMVILLHGITALAAVYNVGDQNGWAFHVAGWEKDKNFKAGDTLVFSYNSNAHNVMKVDKASYDSCSVPKSAPKFQTGNDKIILQKGPNYFICGVPAHCQADMKIAALAA